MKNFVYLLLFCIYLIPPVQACTGVSLQSADGGVVAGRTVEWSLSDAMHYRMAIFPRNREYSAIVPGNRTGMKWTGQYGFVSMTAYGQDYGPDGLNEQGLYVGMYYLPGFAEYSAYDPEHSEKSLSVGDFMQWLLSNFRTIDEVLANLNQVYVVHVEDERFGGAPLPFHWKISDPSGKSIIIEFVNGGNMKIYDAFLGVITNAPTYDWHLTNLRNYIGLAPNPRETLTIDEVNLSALGAGSGMIGLPGDFTPPSRFIRAAAFTASVRPLAVARDAVFEAFRILDSFNIPLGSVLAKSKLPTDIDGATQITSASDLKNRIYYYHTMFNRQVRMIDLKKINFSTVKQQIIDDDSAAHYQVKELFAR